MDLEQLDVLENKISQAVTLIERLRLENQELKRQNEGLRSEMSTKDQMIRQLREENQNLEEIQNQSSLGKEKEEMIRSKVELMLSKLDELQFNL